MTTLLNTVAIKRVVRTMESVISEKQKLIERINSQIFEKQKDIEVMMAMLKPFLDDID